MNNSFAKVYRMQEIKGVIIPGIIKNGPYFFSDFEIYEDGRVSCWNFEDFEHFKKDVKRGFVSVCIPDGEKISINGLGSWTIINSQWIYNIETYIEYVWSIVKQLNPDLTNIFEYSEKKENGIPIMEMSKGSIYKEEPRFPNDFFPEKITGKSLNLFMHDANDVYYLVRLDIYNHNSIIINRLSDPFEINIVQLEKMISEDKIVSTLPQGAEVEILGLGKFNVKEERYSVDISDKFLEIKDLKGILSGEPSTLNIW